MRSDFPVFTTENECQDCYKCVRHCDCKAIRIVEAKASVIPESCVACGDCVRVCPARAKKIRSDLGRLKSLLSNGARLYASIAPSYVGYFRGISIAQVAGALRRLGFEGVSETAAGAEAVSAHACAALKNNPSQKLVISSACPACVDYIAKYHPRFSPYLLPCASPLLSHCRILRDQYGKDIKTVFFGPCAAKKNEADRNPEILTLALTFSDLACLLDERDIPLDGPIGDILLPANEGRFYSLEGGMLDTLRDGNQQVRYTSVSGLENLGRLLSSWDGATGGRTIFLEALACSGGCVNGPVMPRDGATLDTLIQTDRSSSVADSSAKYGTSDLEKHYPPTPVLRHLPDESKIVAALARVGKFSPSDELNCGGCGYDTCRDFAVALVENKAEEAMCHNYLRKNFQRTSNALIRYIPSGVVIVNEKLEITESNRPFAKITGSLEIFDSLGSLNSCPVDRFLSDYADLFESVLLNGGEIEQFHQPYKDKIINLSVFSIALGKYAGAVIQDVTQPELQREQIAEKAREIIRKNVLAVQNVARIFGEHIADSEIILNEIAGTYSTRLPQKEKSP